MDSPKVNGQAKELAANARDSGRPGSLHLTESQRAALQILHYAGLLREHWILIVSATIGIGLAAGLYAKFFMVKFYRAQAVITPLNPDSAMGGSLSMSGPFGGVSSGLASLMSMGGSSDEATLAERDKAIMTSYAFTTDLIDRHHLTQHIARGHQNGKPVSRWILYRKLSANLTSEFDFRSGNLTVYFLDPDPAEARRILGYYLDGLRDQLRNEEVESAASIAASLQDEIRKTSDALLQTQLYELMARQIQRQTIAQVQSDFAFRVVEPPVVPDFAAFPLARNIATLVSFVTLVVLCAFFVIRDFVHRAREQLGGAAYAPEPARVSEPNWTVGERADLPEDPRPPLRRSQL